MPFSKENEQKIKKNYDRIVNGLSIVKIVDSLISKEVLTFDDGERIDSKATRLDKNKEFIRILRKGPEKGYNEFLEELRNDSAYVELADQIEKTEVIIEEQTLENWIGKDRITSEKKNTCLEDRDLLRFSAAIYPSYLIQLAPDLEIPRVEVNAIKRELPYLTNSETWSMEFLLKWRDKNGDSATAGNLVEKLFKAWIPGCLDPKIVRNSWDKL